MTTRLVPVMALCALLLGACATHTREIPPPAPGVFGWGAQVLEATGTANQPESGAGPERFFVGQQASKTAALAELKKQVLSLPVTPEYTLASIVASNLSVKRAVERQLQTAQVISQQQVAHGVFQTRVRLQLESIADILAQHNITPEGMPPLPGEPEKLPPLT
jgi:hypothetical protein